jgi:hypothetical protein
MDIALPQEPAETAHASNDPSTSFTHEITLPVAMYWQSFVILALLAGASRLLLA